MSVWSHIILEGYCLYESMKNKTSTFYSVDLPKDEKSKIKIYKGKRRKNLLYNKDNQRPKWCINKNKERIPQFRCLCNGKKAERCPFFMMCDSDKKDYKMFFKEYDKKCQT